MNSRGASHILCGYISVFLFFIAVGSVSAQVSPDQDIMPAAETVSVKIQGDSIIYRFRKRDTVEAHSSAIELRTVPDSIVTKMQGDKSFEYANDPSFWKKEPPQQNSAFIKLLDVIAKSSLLNWLLYLFLAAIILFVLYQVAVVNNFFVFSRKKRATQVTNFEEEILSPDKLDELINDAVHQKDFRLAVRYLYLKTLQLLNERGLIRLDSKLTNHDYVRQVQPQEKRSEFVRLTNLYEYAWYGEYQLTEEQFARAKTNFYNFLDKK